MSIALITGASGLLGGNLAHALTAQGRRVRVLLRPGSKTFHIDDLPALERVTGDVTDPQSLLAAMQGVEQVYHCAAQVSISRQLTGRIWRVNVLGTENVLAAARQAGVRRVVHCSSVDALGLPEDSQPADEDTPWNWDRLGVETAYARTKLEAQQRALTAARAGQDVVVVCPTFMIGPRDPHPSSGQMILSTARSPLRLGLPGGNNFIAVEDAAAGMIAAAERGQTGRVYILGHQNLSYSQMFALIEKMLGRRAPELRIPRAAACTLGAAGDLWERISGHESPVNSALARLGFVNHFYSPARAVAELGLPQTPVEDAVARAAGWFRTVGMLA